MFGKVLPPPILTEPGSRSDLVRRRGCRARVPEPQTASVVRPHSSPVSNFEFVESTTARLRVLPPEVLHRTLPSGSVGAKAPEFSGWSVELMPFGNSIEESCWGCRELRSAHLAPQRSAERNYRESLFVAEVFSSLVCDWRRFPRLADLAVLSPRQPVLD